MKRELLNRTIYQVYVRNYTKAGTFKGLIKKLDYIKDLGVDIIYLLPIHEIGVKAKKGTLGCPYSIQDYYSIAKELGTLEPASQQLNGPSAKVLDENILAPLGFTRKDAWLCDCLPETRINPSQVKAIREKYNPLIEQYGLNPVTIPERPSYFCDQKRSEEITDELMQSKAELLVLLGDIPIAQYLKKVADVPYSTLGEYVDLYGYGNPTETIINGKTIKVLPLAHPRQIGALGAHSERWNAMHKEWEKSR
jgi:hypothetical protein